MFKPASGLPLSRPLTGSSELAELLQFLSGWPARDPGRLRASLADLAGNPAYGTAQLREEPDRLILLLGGNDGESLFCQVPLAPEPPAARCQAIPGQGEPAPGLSGLNVVRPRAARCGRSTLTPPRHRR
jgi:hypothetical protein